MLRILPMLLFAGCVEVLVDPKVPDFGDAPAYKPEGNPTVELGFYVEQLYAPLHEGDPVPIIFGAQGGRWTMPAVRMKGLALDVTLACQVTTSDGEQLGVLANSERFVVAPDGWAELQAIAIAIQHAPPNEALPLDDVYGKEGTLSCRAATADGKSAERVLRVVLTQG